MAAGRLAGLCLAGLVLTACQGAAPGGKAGSDGKAASAAPAEAAASRSQDPAADPISATPEGESETAALPKAPEPVPSIDPASLIGQPRGALEARLGQPSLVRLEAPAEVWQYRGAACVLDFYLYPVAGTKAGAREDPREVVYLEARDLAAQPLEPRPCLDALLQERSKALSS